MKDVNGPAIWAQAQDRLRVLDSSFRRRCDEVGEAGSPESGVDRQVSKQRLINFCSNDYLDLANNPKVKQAAIEAVEKYGAGAMASRLTCGTLPIHHELEAAIANFKGTEAALVFSSGYLACVGLIQALSLRADDSRVPIIFDRLSHASLVDAATATRRNWRSFPHNDVDSLEILLKTLPASGSPTAVVVTEGVFSMDGDLAPLARLSEVCDKYGALLVIDDAHGTGTMGEGGKGSAALANVADHPHVVQIGTLSKALGSQGGFVAGPAILRELLVNTARTFIFDTALNPAAAGAALASLRILQEEPALLESLRTNIAIMRKLLHLEDCNAGCPPPIIPVILQDEEKTMARAADLRQQGFLVSAIRPPTVPVGTSRLRITLSAAHKEEDVRRLAQAVAVLEAL